MKIKSLSLKKHTRPITHLAFNRESDLLFSTSKDQADINVLLWDPSNGKLIGNYAGHIGVVSFVDINYNSTMIITAGSDKTVRFWEVETGKEITSLLHESMVRCCRFSTSEQMLLSLQSKMYDIPSTIYIFEIHDELRLRRDAKDQPKKPLKKLKDESYNGNFTQAVWTELEKSVVASAEDGLLRKWEVATGELVATEKSSQGSTTSISTARNGHLLICTNQQGSASIFMASNLTPLKVIKSDRAIHAAVLSPKHPLLVLGGGQNSRDVTTTSKSEGKLEVLYYDFVQEKLLGVTKNHFGPIYRIAMSPDASCLVTGGEDSFLRIHYFSQEFDQMCSKIVK